MTWLNLARSLSGSFPSISLIIPFNITSFALAYLLFLRRNYDHKNEKNLCRNFASILVLFKFELLFIIFISLNIKCHV